jgi:hypothetical protein
MTSQVGSIPMHFRHLLINYKNLKINVVEPEWNQGSAWGDVILLLEHEVEKPRQFNECHNQVRAFQVFNDGGQGLYHNLDTWVPSVPKCNILKEK